MKRTFALSIAGAVAAAAALFAAPQAANAQVGISVGFGSGWGYNHGYYPDLFGVGLGVTSPGYYDDGFFDTDYYAGTPVYYAPAPAYRVVTTRVVRRAPRVAVAAPVYYAPRRVVRTRVVTRAPRVVTRQVVTRNVVSYAAPEIRSSVRTRVIDRSPTRRIYY